ncbi:MAG: hypothetical protein ACOY3D_03875, partial [Candidatus Omnitrophota bacterium]
MNLFFQKLKHGKISGQVVVLMVLLIAAIVVFIAITINLGKVAQLKAAISLAAQAAAIDTASQIGSYAYGLVQKALDGYEWNCEASDWVLKIAGYVLAFVLVLTGNIPAAAKVLELLIVLGSVTMDTINTRENIRDVRTAFNKQYAQMTASQRFTEIALTTALFAAVTDPIEVTDIEDIDMDVMRTDKISRALFLYQTERLDLLLSRLQLLRIEIYGDNESFFVDCAVDGFAEKWANFLYYLGYEQLPSFYPCRQRDPDPQVGEYEFTYELPCPPSAGEESFLTTLGEDGGSRNASSGLYQLFYDIEYNWGYDANRNNREENDLWDFHNLWRSIYQPCWYSEHALKECAASTLYCREPDASALGLDEWHCFDPGSIAYGDEVDDMRESMLDFLFWSFYVIWSEDSCYPTNDLVSGIENWLFVLYSLDNPDNWYNTLHNWESALGHMYDVLHDVRRWITPMRSQCAVFDESGNCLETWESRYARVDAAMDEVRDAEKTVANFRAEIKSFAETIRPLLVFPNSITYSWKDGLGWHHVYAQVNFSKMFSRDPFPRIEKKTGTFRNCYVLEPEYCGKRGAGA